MQRSQKHLRKRSQKRSRYSERKGFTLIELLVVIGVVAILASLSFVMVKRFGVTSRDTQTEATLRKADAALSDRYEALGRFFEISHRRAGDPPPRLKVPVYVESSDRQRWENDGNNAPPRPLVELLSRKKYERKHFPMSFDEGPFDNSSPPVSLITGLPQGQFPANHDSNNTDTESAEVLYWMLTSGAKFGAEEVAVVDFIDREIADTDGDGLLEIVDGWGNPLRFYRWPTRLWRPRPTAQETIPAQSNNDPPINTGRAAELLTGSTLSRNQLQSDPQDPLGEIPAYLAPLPDPPDFASFESNFHTANTWHAPLVVSAGADGKFGIYSPVKDKTFFGHLAQPDNTNDPTGEFLQDNISNLLLRVGGK